MLFFIHKLSKSAIEDVKSASITKYQILTRNKNMGKRSGTDKAIRNIMGTDKLTVAERQLHIPAHSEHPGRVESWRGNPIEHSLSVSGVSPFVPG